MSQSQKGKKSSTAADDRTLQSSADRRPLVASRTSPLIRVRFRNPIRLSLSGGCSSASAAGGGESRATATSTSAGEAEQSGGGSGQGCDRRRRSADSVSMSSETAAGDRGTAVTTDDLSLVPRTRQYQKHELLQDRSPESGLSEVEAFLLEKQRLMELASTGDNDNDDEKDQDKLVPRAPHYVPHPILQVKTETGFTELELYLKQKEAQLEQSAEHQPAADADAATS